MKCICITELTQIYRFSK